MAWSTCFNYLPILPSVRLTSATETVSLSLTVPLRLRMANMPGEGRGGDTAPAGTCSSCFFCVILSVVLRDQMRLKEKNPARAVWECWGLGEKKKKELVLPFTEALCEHTLAQ